MPLFLGVGLWLVELRWQSMLAQRPLDHFLPDRKKGAGLLITAWIILSLATLIWSPWLGLLAGLISLAGYAYWVGGSLLFRCVAPLILMLVLLLRPPVDLDLLLVTDLRTIQTHWTSSLLDLLGITHFCSGAIIEIPGHRNNADQVSSGYRSQLLLLGFALAYGLWRQRPWWQLLLLLTGGLVFLAIGDICLLTLSIFSNAVLHFNPLLGWGKLIVRLCNLAVSVGLVISLDHLLTALAGLFGKSRRSGERPKPIIATDSSSSTDSATPSGISLIGNERPTWLPALATLMRRPVSWWGWGLGLLFAFIGMIQMVWVPLVVNLKPTLPMVLQTNLVVTLPEQIGGWRQISAPTNMPSPYRPPRLSKLNWTYQSGRVKAQIALIYPYEDFVPVTSPGPDTGWRIHKRQIYETDQTAEKQPYVEVQMVRAPGQSAALFYAYFTPQAQWLRPSVVRWIRSQFQFLDRPRIGFQTQVLATHYLALQPSEVENVRKLFLEIRYYLALQVMNKAGGAP